MRHLEGWQGRSEGVRGVRHRDSPLIAIPPGIMDPMGTMTMLRYLFLFR